MASAAGQNVQLLRQDIQHELTTANQLAWMISNELQLIKNFTNPGGEFESNIKTNANLIATLANTSNIDMANIPPFVRRNIDLNTYEYPNQMVEHNTVTNDSEMDGTQ